MDYLYINAIVKEVYKDLPCGCPFPPEYNGSLQAAMRGQDCLTNPQVSNVLSYFAVKVKDQAPVLVLSNVQKHTNSASVGKFSQCIGWVWNGDLLRNFDEVLCSGFYSQEEINETALQKGSFALPKDKCRELPELPLTLSPKVKQTILTTIMLRWLRFEAPLRIAVPRDVEYNSYVLGAVQKIYALLPTALRAKAGFCSYLPDEKHAAGSIFIGFIPEELADSRTLSLDGSSRASIEILNCGTRNAMLDYLIEYLANAPEAEVQGLLEEIYEDVEGAGDSGRMEKVDFKNYQTVGEALYLLTLEGPAVHTIPQWRKFFQNVGRFSDRMQQRIRKHILDSTRVEELCQLFQADCREKSRDPFEKLENYRVFCEDNQPLADALWDTAVVLLTEQGRSFSAISVRAEQAKETLVPVLNAEKLDRLFQQAIEEQLRQLQGTPADTCQAVEGLKSKANGLLEQVSARDIPDRQALQEEIQQFLAELDQALDAFILADWKASLEAIKARPGNTLKEIKDRLAEVEKLCNEVSGKKLIQNVGILLDALAQYDAELEERRNVLICNQLTDRFKALAAQPAETIPQIKAVLNLANQLLSDIELEPQTPQIVRLQENVRRCIAEREAAANSSAAKYQQVIDVLKVNGAQYFTAVQKLSKCDQTSLDAGQTESLRQELRRYRPKSLESYEIEFESTYHKPLILANVATRSDYECGIIIRDICELNTISLRCTKGQQAKQTAQEIDNALHIARKISDNCRVEVSYEGSKKDTEWFRRLLQLAHTSSTMGSAEGLEKAFGELVNSGAYSGDELLPAIEMLRCCGMKFAKLFNSILQGKIRNCTELQYQMAYTAMWNSMPGNPKENLAKLESYTKDLDVKDETAYKAFRKFVKSNTPEKKHRLLLPIVISVSSVIVAVSLVAVFLLGPKIRAQKPASTIAPTVQTTVPTEVPAPIAYPELFQFYSKNRDAIDSLCGADANLDFAAQSRKVAELLDFADEETSNLVLERYNNGCGTTVAIDKAGTCVRWEEYFFWMCSAYADGDADMFREALEQTEPIPQVLNTLRIIHHGQPGQMPETELPETPETAPTEEPAKTNATEPTNTTEETNVTEATDAVETTDAAEESYVTVETNAAKEITVPSEEETQAMEDFPEEGAVVEPNVTVADVKNAITEAAMVPYAEAQSNLYELQLIEKIFGSDFQKDFREHIDCVRGLALTEDGEYEWNAHLIRHYRSIPGDSVIRFKDMDMEVTWNEYVFWEGWLLAQQGAVEIGENTFDGSLNGQVFEILSVIHCLIDEDEYPTNLDELIEAQTQPTEEDDVESPDPEQSDVQDSAWEEITESAGASFENARRVFRAIYNQVKNTTFSALEAFP